jgi:hypothetical protein
VLQAGLALVVAALLVGLTLLAQLQPLGRDLLAWRLGGGEVPQGCGGAERLCGRPYSRVAFAAAHNAHSSLADGFAMPNNLLAFERALRAGLPALMLDVVASAPGGADARLCHENCAFGSTGLAEGLGRVAAYLAANPSYVVTLLLELVIDGAGAAGADASALLLLKRQLADALNATGLLPHAYVPRGRHAANRSDWPTLRAMLASGARLVVLSDARAAAAADHPWDLYVWDYAVETRFQYFGREDMEPTAGGCAYGRGDPAAALLIFNHFVTNPLASLYQAQLVNHEFLRERAEGCRQALGRLPNFVAVDFWSDSDVVEVVLELNG